MLRIMCPMHGCHLCMLTYAYLYLRMPVCAVGACGSLDSTTLWRATVRTGAVLEAMLGGLQERRVLAADPQQSCSKAAHFMLLLPNKVVAKLRIS